MFKMRWVVAEDNMQPDVVIVQHGEYATYPEAATAERKIRKEIEDGECEDRKTHMVYITKQHVS